MKRDHGTLLAIGTVAALATLGARRARGSRSGVVPAGLVTAIMDLTSWDVGDQSRDDGFIVVATGPDGSSVWRLFLEGWGVDCVENDCEALDADGESLYPELRRLARKGAQDLAVEWSGMSGSGWRDLGDYGGDTWAITWGLNRLDSTAEEVQRLADDGDIDIEDVLMVQWS